MKKVYICSPYASQGIREENVKKAKRYCKAAIDRGCLPIAPHVFYTQILSDDIEEERAAGLRLGLELLKECDEIWVFGSVTGGMVNEVQLAKDLGVQVYYIPENGGEQQWPQA